MTKKAIVGFFVVSLVVVLGVSLHRQAPAPDSPAVASPVPASPASRSAAAGYECLTTPNGIPRKVIVKRDDASAFEGYDFTGKPHPLKFFRKYFVFKERRGRGYLVGEATGRESVLGWVRREDVLPWNHAQAAYFINKRASGAAPVRIWMNRRDVGQSARPHFEEDLRAYRTTEPFPILQKEGSAVRVAFLWNKPGDLKSVAIEVDNEPVVRGGGVTRGSEGKSVGDTAGEIERLADDLHRMDIALVMDVTSSMRPYMAMVRQRMIQIVDALGSLGSADFPVATHIGVVAYRDYADAATSFMTRTLDLTRDRRRVRRFLEDLQPYSEGRGKNEAVFEGLAAGIDGLDWGPHSYRVLVLVGDAPPHDPQDVDTRFLKERRITVDSRFFGRSFVRNVKKIHSRMDRSGIHFYALGVGGDPEMQETFAAIAANGEFMSLANAEEFIARLEAQLRADRETHAESGETVAEILERIRDDEAYRTSELDEDDIEALVVRNISPETLDELVQSRIQTGWFDVDDVASRVSVCVYMRRRDLELEAQDLRTEIRDGNFSENELAILKSVLAPYVDGKESLENVVNIDDLMDLVEDLPLPPDVVRSIFGQVDDLEITANLRNKLNNLLILLYQDELFNEYEEGWIPMEYLPGSLTSSHTETE